MLTNNLIIRDYQPNDAKYLALIFSNTIHAINKKHYTNEQINAWAPKNIHESEHWAVKFSKTKPIIATLDEKPVGFAELESDGHIDCFYCHHEFIGQGIGKSLMNEIINRAKTKGLKHLYVEASITAKPFFEKQGFRTIKEQKVEIRGCQLINYQMEKDL